MQKLNVYRPKVIFLLMFLLLSLHVQAKNQHFDQDYQRWKAQQQAIDAQLGSSPSDHYLSQPTKQSSSKISLNKATLAELQQLHGVGEKKAIAIIEYRNKNKGFKAIDELQNVKGFGPALFNKNKTMLGL